MSKLRVIESKDFASTISTGVVLVDFGAPWCGPCKTLEPLVYQLGHELDGKLTAVKVDIDFTPELAVELGVMSVPTLMLFKDGKRLAVRSGGQSLDQLREFAQQAL